MKLDILEKNKGKKNVKWKQGKKKFVFGKAKEEEIMKTADKNSS